MSSCKKLGRKTRPLREHRCRHGPLYRTAVSTRAATSTSDSPDFLISSRTTTMASKKAAPLMRPAVNGFGARLLRAECPQTVHYRTRTLSSQASRPRKLAQQPQPQQFVRFASSETGKEQLGRTGLYELHNKYGAKFVPFGGYSMPVQYSDMSIIDSHNWTREKASLFDVGHMSVAGLQLMRQF